jgi:hypothetical protein
MTTRYPAGMSRYRQEGVNSDWGITKEDRKDTNEAHAIGKHFTLPLGGHRFPPGTWEIMKPVAGKATK